MPGMLSLDQMKAEIQGGRVMQMPDGRMIHKVEDLPTEADIALVSGSLSAQAQARAVLEARKKELDDQLAKLDAAPLALPADPKAPAPEFAKAPKGK